MRRSANGNICDIICFTSESMLPPRSGEPKVDFLFCLEKEHSAKVPLVRCMRANTLRADLLGREWVEKG